MGVACSVTKKLEAFADGLHLVSTETPHGAVERAEFGALCEFPTPNWCTVKGHYKAHVYQ